MVLFGKCLLPRINLTARFVRDAVCPAGERKINFFDINNPGFLLEVRSSGGKTYYQRYRDRRGQERQCKIGPPRVLSLSQSRRKARKVLAEALLGNDPQKQRQDLRDIPTLAEFTRERYLPFAKNAKRSWRTDETVLRVQIIPVLGRVPLDQITTLALASYSVGWEPRATLPERSIGY